ncbi:hypothetical protein HK098_002285 [Nowakowskiella sp. JEL0407]|nr:hypothetical protein HK098_002285 [Nowakowskiella sp. JEL0407]
MVEVVIEGAKNKCFDARKEIDAVVDERVIAIFKFFNIDTSLHSLKVNTETIVLLIPASLHKVIIGSGGVRIKKLVEHFGGQDKVKIQFPRSGSTGVVGDAITIRANKKLLPTIRAELDNALAEALNEESDSSSKANGVKAHRVPIFEVEADVTEEGVVSLDGDDANSYGKNSIFELITLSKGDTPRNNMVKELMRKFGAAVILLPHESDSSQVVVKIVVHKGEEASIALIKKEIQANVRVATKVKIPENIMSTLERQGSGHDAELSALNEVARRIRADHGVSVDISKSEGNLEIRGDQKKSQRAVIAAEAALAELGKHTASAQLPVAPHLRPHIIGRMGATITKIREKTGTHVEIVRGKNAQSDDIVMFRGDSESVEAAKAMVEEIVSKQEERARNEKIQTASKSAQTLFTASPARSSNLSAARIDDDPSEVGSNSDVAESNGVRHVPGFHGRVNKKDVPRPQTGNVTSGGYLSSAAAYESANKADDNQWQVQKGRKPKKVEEDDLTGLSTDGNAENTANGDGVNKKKKKKKGKAGASTSATEEATPPSSAAAVQLVPPTPVPTPNFAESPKPEVSHKPAQKVTATPVKPTTQQVKTETTTVATIEKDYVVVEDISETEVVDDGWITPVRKSKPAKNNDGVTPVSQVGSIPSAASVLIDESASKKKKNKKKKTGGAEVNGQ